MTQPDLSREEIAWLAGLLEGEGTFSTTSNGRKGKASAKTRYVYPCVQVAMTDRDVVERVARMIGGGVKTARRSHRNPNHKDAYITVVMGWPAVDVINLVLSWMGERRRVVINERISAYTAGRRPDGKATHCRRGHELTGKNVYVYPSGQQRCVTCRRAWQRETRGVEMRVCKECGKPVPTKENANNQYCSLACKARRRARHDAERYRKAKEKRMIEQALP